MQIISVQTKLSAKHSSILIMSSLFNNSVQERERKRLVAERQRKKEKQKKKLKKDNLIIKSHSARTRENVYIRQ
jgi:hypothetical protein